MTNRRRQGLRRHRFRTRLLLIVLPAAMVLIAAGLQDPARAQSLAASPPFRGAFHQESRASSAGPGSSPATVEQPGGQTPSPGFWAALRRRSDFLGDIGGLRPALGRYGVTLDMQETSEVLGNLTGGIRRGAAYDGVTTLSLGMETDKALGWKGGLFHASALQLHGRGLSTRNLGSLQTASGIEAARATRLWELWYQQSLFHDRMDVRLGQQSVDQEFLVSEYAGLFVNTMMGWPMVPSADLPAGGPAYPLSSLGVRVRARPTGRLTLLAGVFDDNPAGPGSGDPQRRDASGTKFRLGDSPLLIAEIQYSHNRPAADDPDRAGFFTGLPGTYKLGLWYDAGSFADQELDTAGLSLADPASSGVPRRHRGDYSFYAVVDQRIWRPDPHSPREVGFFLRAMSAPEKDRNLIDASLNVGLTLTAPLPGREQDIAGVGLGYAHVSSRARALDRDTAFFTATPYPVRTSEEFLEVTYRFQAAPWWQLQPDFQYTFNPGGGIPNPDDPSQRIRNEAVIGLRTNLTF